MVSAVRHDDNRHGEVTRRDFMTASICTAAGVVTGTVKAATDFPFQEATFCQLQSAMSMGALTSEILTGCYIGRIEALDKAGPLLRSVLEINPDALSIARRLDLERRAHGPRSLLHGIPLLIKGNIDTADRMMTTAGSLALVGPPPLRDATVVANLRRAGAVILGKSNMSEWASHRSYRATSGWSALGGQCKNPYVLDRNPSGSSSGSAVASSANLCAASIGTETDLSIVSPASVNCVVGIKPTTGLTSRCGLVAVSTTHDTVGPHARTVEDAAILLSELVDRDPCDPLTSSILQRTPVDYASVCDPKGLKGARIGVLRRGFSGFCHASDGIYDQAIQALKDAGATVLDPIDFPNLEQITNDRTESIVHAFEFKRGLEEYLGSRVGLSIRTLADLIEFNKTHAAQEMPFFDQELFYAAESTTHLRDPRYVSARQTCLSQSREQGIDKVLTQYNLHALVAPTSSPAWVTDLVNGDHLISPFPTVAGMAGYPTISVPAGFFRGLPVGISFIGTAFSEALLIKFSFSFEQMTKVRRTPQFIDSLQDTA